ncbi:MAG TPA: phenylalanine--tRNA ligase subunit beta [Candidatus Portnoybacteria bacterium]|nr:phenylalanine--tRNA ligase subunit beta [Candidatus Portnoybacteria bacterium]
MTISYNWLKEYLPRLPKPAKLAELLTLHSFEVERVSKVAGDWVLEIDVLPNRAHDCLSHLGIAREIAALTGNKLKMPKAKIDEERGERIESLLKVKIKDSKLCPRYTARIIKEIKIKDSPVWLKKHLQAVGVRPINNIVDITNYLMLETGQPMHAFDYDKIKGHQMTVRSARLGERVATLDGQRHKLEPGIIVIEDEQKLIDLAGIMGGQNSQVSNQTKTVVLQAANFDPLSIRRACQKLSVRTDASDRYEREIDSHLALFALEGATCLIQKLAGGKIVPGVLDIYPVKRKPAKIRLDLKEVENLLGLQIPGQKIVNILKSLEFKVKSGGEFLEITVPTFRLDVTIPEDLIEEIARIYGYENINSVSPRVELNLPKQEEILERQDMVKDVLVGAGFTEVYNYSFVSQGDRLTLELENPTNLEQKYLRTSLILNLLKNVKENLKYSEIPRIFELGQIYLASQKKLPQERKMLTGVALDFAEAKGIINLLFEKLGLDLSAVSYQSSDLNFLWHPTQSAIIKIAGQSVGRVGQIHPAVLADLEIKQSITVFDLDFEKLTKSATSQRTYQPIPRYPSVTLDLAVLIDQKTTWQEIKEIVGRVGGKLVQKVELFDLYQGEEIPQGKRSLAFHIIYRAKDKTLKDEEVNLIQAKIIKALEKRGGQVRKK